MKKIVQKLLLFLACIFNATIFAIIIKHDSIASIFQYIDDQKKSDTLILFDIDYTLIEPIWTFGRDYSDLLFKHVTKQKNNELYVMGKECVIRADITQYFFKPVEAITASVVHQLQQDGFTVLALTARNYLIAYWTYKELYRCNIDFEFVSLPVPSNTNNDREKYHLEYGIIFRKENYDKGSMLVDMLRDYMLTPTLILCMDDTLQNLEDIQNMLQITRPKVEFIGIHYCPS